MKKTVLGLLFLGIIFSLTGCGKKSVTLDNGVKLETKGNCVVTECIKKIESTNTVEEINKIIGVDGVLTDEKYNKYYWELSENSGIEVTYYSSNKGTIVVDVDRKLLANTKVNLSKYTEIKSLLDNGTSLNYDQFVSKLGDVQGTLIEKSAYTLKYTWVNSKGGYLNASFAVSTGNCTSVIGRY